jgi:uncharacterized protein (TIGR04255 family)
MTQERLKNPPITEALIDLRADLAPGVRTDDLAEFHRLIASTYPESKNRMSFSGSFGFGPDGNAHVSVPPGQHTGFMCWSGDRLQAAQARLDGFTLNRLHPYTHWAQFSTEAKALWTQYVRVAKPTAVVRVALRYINRIELPNQADPKDFFRTLPVLPTGFPQSIGGLLLRLELPVQTGRTSVVTMATEQADPGAEKRTWILDIDVGQQGHFEPSGSEIWTILEELRTLKNKVFFESLTPTALGAYK